MNPLIHMDLYSSRQQGFSMVELLIALILGIFIIAAMSTVFLQSKRGFLENEQQSRIQESGRFALRVLVRDITMSGFLGEHLNRGTIELDDDLPAITNECGAAGWYYDLTAMIQVASESGGSAVTTVFPCIATGDYLAGTDAIAVKRVADGYDNRLVNTASQCEADALCCGTSVAQGCEINTERMYLQTNKVIGLLYDDPISSTSQSNEQPARPRENWMLMHRVYFVRPYSINPGDNIPSLCRYQLTQSGGAFTMQPQCLVDGVENLQVEVGVDMNNDRVADVYTPTPTVAQMDLAVSMRIFVLVRGLNELISVNNTKTYNLGSVTVGPFNDGYMRRIYSTNIQLRNLSNLNALGL